MVDEGTQADCRWQPELHVAIAAATEAGNLIRAGFCERIKAVEDKKNASDVVTKTDTQAGSCASLVMLVSLTSLSCTYIMQYDV